MKTPRAVRSSIYSGLLAVAACGDGGPTPPPPPVVEELQLEPAQVDITVLNTTAPLSARIPGQSTPTPTMTVVSETRWLNDAPVLDPDSLARGRVHGAAPGAATVNVSAFGKSKQLTVRVSHPRPAVLSATAPGALGENDTITLRGYRLHENLGAVSLGGLPISVQTRDSATLRLRVGAAAAAVGCGAAPTDSLRIAGADLLVAFARPRRRASELQLDVGQAQLLDDVHQACLMLPMGTRYALAFLDTRAIEQSKLPRMQHRPILEYSVRIAPPNANAMMASEVDGDVAPASDVVSFNRSGADIYDPFSRATPWQLNEDFSVIPLQGAHPLAQFRVQRIYNNHYVVASEAGMPTDTLTRTLASLDTTFARFFRDAEPLYKSWLSPRMPRTSVGSGQLLVLVIRGCPFNVAGRAITRDVDPTLASSWVILATCGVPQTPASTRAGMLLLHELAHIWQFESTHATYGTGFTGAADTWAIEGGADLAVNEVMRRRANLTLTSNWVWASSVFNDTPADAFTHLAMANGTFTGGYAPAAAFLQHNVVSRVRAGADVDAAVSHVLKSSLQGWYGYGFTSQLANGFVSAMRDMEVSFEPGDALLRWTMSQAIDDLTSSTSLQNHTYRSVQSAHPQFGWRPSGELTATAGVGLNVTRQQGSPAYVYLNNDAAAGTYVLTSTVPGVKWMIARYR